MRAIIGENTKSDIIKQYLNGKKRDAIAQATGVSAGVVSKVVAMWKMALEIPIAEDMRELAVGLHKLNLSASECAIGARIFKMMKTLGLKEGEADEFLSDTYRHSKELGIPPETIASNLKQLIDLSGTVPMSEMPVYLMQKAHEKVELETKIQGLRSQQLEAKKLAENALNQQRITTSELESYLSFKREMAKYEISMDNIPKFTNMLDVIGKTTDLHPAVVFSKFRDLDEVAAGKILREQLKEEIEQLNEQKAAHMQVLKTYVELETLGFGLKELRLLRNTIREIANENGIPPFVAVPEFISNIEEDYDTVLGFKSKLEKLKSEIQDEQSKRAATQSQPHGEVDLTSIFRSIQGSKVIQGQSSVTSQGKNMTKTDNAADHISSLGTDPKAANIGITFPAQIESNDSSQEQSKIENGDEVTDEKVRDFQAHLQNKYQTDRDFGMNATLATQGARKNSSQQQSKSIDGDGFIDAQIRLLRWCFFKNKDRTDSNFDVNVNSI